jgi:hypothetical protein
MRLVVELIDFVRDHLQASVLVDDRQDVAAPVHRGNSIAEGGLLLLRDAQAHVLDAERREHLLPDVPVDRTTVDPLDDRAEDLPTARRVVGGVGARLPPRRRLRDARDDLGVGHVGVEQLGVRVREAAGVREHVADRAPLLACTPAVDVLADPVVEAELSLLPQLEDGDHRHGLARGVEEHEVVDLEATAGAGLADGRVQQDVAVPRHVALRPVVPAVRPPSLEEVGDGGEVGSRLGDRHGKRA